MDYKIIATLAKITSEGWRIAVAIESAPDYIKVYSSTTRDYPEWSDVIDTATRGSKVGEKSAQALFSTLPSNYNFE